MVALGSMFGSAAHSAAPTEYSVAESGTVAEFVHERRVVPLDGAQRALARALEGLEHPGELLGVGVGRALRLAR